MSDKPALHVLNGHDPIDEAIVAAEQRPVEMVQVNLQMPPQGRPALVAVPRDITEQELISLLVAIPTALVQVRASNPATRLIIPS